MKAWRVGLFLREEVSGPKKGIIIFAWFLCDKRVHPKKEKFH